MNEETRRPYWVGLILVAASSVSLSVSSACTIREYKAYWQRAIAFDYCGLSFREMDVSPVKVGSGALSGRWVSERNFYSLVKDFSSLLMELEGEAFSRSGEVSQDVVERIRSSLVEQQARSLSPESRFPVACFRGNVERLLYSCVRILEDDSAGARLSETAFRRILPESVLRTDYSGCSWLFEGTKEGERRIATFRDLVLLSIRIRERKRSTGRFPSSVDSLLEGVCPKLASPCLAYDVKGDYWRLVVSKWRNARSRPQELLVPQIQRAFFEGASPDLPVMLSSDFSRQRRRIYEQGCSVEVGNRRFRGEICNGRIVFKREDTGRFENSEFVPKETP